MKLYAICWQDNSEPWGWAPIYEDWEDTEAFHWDLDEAHRTLGKIVATGEYASTTTLTVKEWDLPDPVDWSPMTIDEAVEDEEELTLDEHAARHRRRHPWVLDVVDGKPIVWTVVVRGDNGDPDVMVFGDQDAYRKFLENEPGGRVVSYGENRLTT